MMQTAQTIVPKLAPHEVRALTRAEMPLLQEHLLRLDASSRRERFNGVADDAYIIRYADRCLTDGTVVIGFFQDGELRGAAELHVAQKSPDLIPEVAFSVEPGLRHRGVGSQLFTRLIGEAKKAGHTRLRITTGADNEPMRALANKFGAKLTFRQGESTGTIDLTDERLAHIGEEATAAPHPALAVPVELAKVAIDLNEMYWKSLISIYGLSRAA